MLYNCRFCGKELTPFNNNSSKTALNCKDCRVEAKCVGAPPEYKTPSRNQILIAHNNDTKQEVICFEDIVVDIYHFHVDGSILTSGSIYKWHFRSEHSNLICDYPIIVPLTILKDGLDPSDMEKFQRTIKCYVVFQ
jgi:hypothetical protein